MSEYVEIYKADDGWRWRLKGANHQIMATGEAYTTKWGVRRAVKKIRPHSMVRELP